MIETSVDKIAGEFGITLTPVEKNDVLFVMNRVSPSREYYPKNKRLNQAFINAREVATIYIIRIVLIRHHDGEVSEKRLHSMNLDQHLSAFKELEKRVKTFSKGDECLIINGSAIQPTHFDIKVFRHWEQLHFY